ncbi:MAG: hypothetical protein AB7F76_07190 [Parvibaculaceae bacterium]
MKPEDGREEADRTLRRLDEQAEKILGHRAVDPEAEDRIEILGKRIGRILSIVLAIGLIVYLWRTYFAE